MRIALTLFFCALCTTVQAQAIYRSVMPDGKIVFGDKPAPGAKESKPMALKPSNVATPGPTSTPGPSARQQGIESAGDAVVSAQQNLERSRAALEAGSEPTADERIGTKTGTRTTEAYDQRIKSLEQGVAEAQKQLNDAQGVRNDIR